MNIHEAVRRQWGIKAQIVLSTSSVEEDPWRTICLVNTEQSIKPGGLIPYEIFDSKQDMVDGCWITRDNIDLEIEKLKDAIAVLNAIKTICYRE